MKRSLLSRLNLNGRYYLIGALLLLPGVPLYQLLVLNPLQYGAILNSGGSNHFALYLAWIGNHMLLYIIYRILLIAAFALLLTLPFTLFRIIVAQEIVDQQEREEEDVSDNEDQEEVEPDSEDGMPPYAWRGKGFAVIAAWAGLSGLCAYIVGAIIGTLYLIVVSRGFTAHTSLPANFTLLYSIFSLISNVLGIGLLALATLFFGALIARRGRHLWPTIWIFFGYTALATAALLSGSAVASASAPTEQAVLTTPAFLLFGLWVLWLGIMLVRLQPE